jgi:hypothetical protein
MRDDDEITFHHGSTARSYFLPNTPVHHIARFSCVENLDKRSSRLRMPMIPSMDIDISPIEVKVFVSEREKIMIFSQEGLRFVNNSYLHLLLHSAGWLDKFDEP